MSVLMRVEGEVLRPAFEKDREAIRKIRQGALVEVTAKRQPSARMRRFYWALLGIVADNHPFYTDREVIHDVIRIGIQLVRISVMMDGTVVMIPRSTANSAMNFEEFKDFFNRAMDYVVTSLLPGVVKEEVIREIEEALGMTLEEAQARDRPLAIAKAEEVIDVPWEEVEDE